MIFIMKKEKILKILKKNIPEIKCYKMYHQENKDECVNNVTILG